MADLRRIGRSELETPPLILGGNVFGWTIDEATSFDVLDAFVAGGGRMIDTADVYMAGVQGNVGGESETIIGRWLKRRGRRDDVLITTKVGLLAIDGVKGLSRAHVEAAIHGSLTRLGTDYVDLYLSHQDDESVDQDAVAETFGALVKAGKVRAVGASNFDAGRLASAIAAQERKSVARYQALQNQYNLMERADYEGAVQDFCVEHEIGMTPYFGLAAGYLTGKYRTEQDLHGTRSQRARKYMEGHGPQVLAALDAVVEETGATHAQIALAWIAAQPGIAAPIASATSVTQLEDLLGAMELTLNPDQLKRLDEASRVAETA
jgi:aryl-alcohol dehydrogenase-like predicted oxidoreductase